MSLKHGAFSLTKLGPRVEQLADEIRELVPAYRPPDDVTVQLLAISLARIEAIYETVERATAAGELDSCDRRLRQWVNSAAAQADKLAMTPTARGRLGLDVAQTRRALTITDLHEQAELEQHDREQEAGEVVEQ